MGSSSTRRADLKKVRGELVKETHERLMPSRAEEHPVESHFRTDRATQGGRFPADDAFARARAVTRRGR